MNSLFSDRQVITLGKYFLDHKGQTIQQALEGFKSSPGGFPITVSQVRPLMYETGRMTKLMSVEEVGEMHENFKRAKEESKGNPSPDTAPRSVHDAYLLTLSPRQLQVSVVAALARGKS